MSSGGVSSGGRFDSASLVIQCEIMMHKNIYQMKFSRLHAHHLVMHVECMVQLQHQPWATSTVEREDR